MRLDLFGKHPSAGGRPKGLLGRLAPSWRRAPVRRVAQAACLVGFAVLFLHVSWPGGGGATRPTPVQDKELLDAESFLMLDPLAVLAAAVAGRAAVGALAVVAVLLAACLVFPRGFCGYVCPLGTSLDLFDWLVSRRVRRFRLRRRGRWVHARYFVLAAVIVAAAFGVQLSGYVAAIPVLTRGWQFAVTPVQLAIARGWDFVPEVGPEQVVSLGLLAGVALLGLLTPRFWCRCLCPTGATLSLWARLRLTERKADSRCVACGQCARACSFDAIRDDFTTRGGDCTFCQDCGGACPAGAIHFRGRWRRVEPPVAEEHPKELAISRRGLLGGAFGGVAAGLGLGRVFGGEPASPVRPPGSMPEVAFRGLCVRCGSCLRACPTRVLQPLGLRGGLEALWTPYAEANFSGCDPGCNNCGQVCPTGAIRALPLAEKHAAHMGRAAVNERTCLPHAGRGECRLCEEVCTHAGHKAIEFIRVGVEVDENGLPVEDSGLLAPRVLAEKCVGCGLCQARCSGINVASKGLLGEAAIVVEAGDGKDDRITRGSYLALREAERKRAAASRPATRPGGGYVTDF